MIVILLILWKNLDDFRDHNTQKRIQLHFYRIRWIIIIQMERQLALTSRYRATIIQKRYLHKIREVLRAGVDGNGAHSYAFWNKDRISKEMIRIPSFRRRFILQYQMIPSSYDLGKKNSFNPLNFFYQCIIHVYSAKAY